MVFLLGVTSNLAAWMDFQKSHHTAVNANPTVDPTINSSMALPPSSSYNQQEEERFGSDLTHMIHAFSVITIFAWITPSIFCLAMACLGMNGSNSPGCVTWI